MRTLRLLPLVLAVSVAACGGNELLKVATNGLADGTLGVPYTAKLAATGGSEEGYKWSIAAGALPGGMELSSGGDITGTPTADGNFGFTVRVEDSDKKATNKSLTLTIKPSGNVLAIDTASLPPGTVTEAYSEMIAASGGSGGYVFTLASGTLPTGLALTAGGTLAGTPTAAGSYDFTIQVADADSATAMQMFSVRIDGATGFRITTTILPNGATGQPYSAPIDSADGTGDITWALSVGVLPGGLTIGIDGVTTTIAGTPTEFGTFDFTVRATDVTGATASRMLTIIVTDGVQPLEIATTTVADALVGTPYSATLIAVNGSNMGYTWAVTSGTLPAGLSLGATGTPATTITGTPAAAGDFTVQITVMDSDGGSANVGLTITVINPPLMFTPANLPDGGVAAAYNETLTAIGGSASGHTWNITTGALPPGLTLNANGATATIDGTPTTPGTYAFDVQLTDDGGGMSTNSYSVEVFPELVVDTATIANTYVGMTVTASLTASGGTQMGYAWTVTSGALPPGLAVSATAPFVVSGAPTAAGTYTFTLAVTDSRGGTATRDFTVEVFEALAIPATLPTATTGIAYSENIIVSGGAPGAFTWTLTGGTLPPGLILGTSTTNTIPLSGTATTLGTYMFDLRAEDSYIGSVAQTITMIVFQPLQIDTVVIPAAATARPFVATISASGGSQAGYVWSILAGALPSGLTIQTSGTPSTMISGTTTATGTYNFTVQLFDSDSATAVVAYTMRVVPPLQIATTVINGWETCLGSSASIVSTGGTGAGHRWTVSAGAMPTGWRLVTTGSPSTTVYGRATVAGQETFTLTVTDNGGLMDSQQYTVSVPAAVDPQRISVLVGDYVVDNETAVFTADVCGMDPGPLTQISPVGSAGDASLSADLAQISPDGTKVVFVGDFATAGIDDLWLYDLTANPPTAAVNLTGYLGAGTAVEDVFWAPNSNLLAFIADPTVDDRNELFVVNVTNPAAPGTPLVISGAMGTLDNDVSDDDVFWAPNSTGVVYQADIAADSVFELFYVNLTNPAAPVAARRIHPTITGTQDCEDDVYWAPDASGVIFRCDIVAANQDELWFTALPSATPTAVLVNNTGYDVSGGDVDFDSYRFAPNGAVRVYYIADEVNNGSQEIWMAPFVGGAPTAPVRAMAALAATQEVTLARWNAQGTHIAFRADLGANGVYDLYILDVSGALPAVPTQVSTMPASGDIDVAPTEGFSFEWSPDGTKIAYIGDQDLDDVDRAYVADVSGAPPYTTNVITPMFNDPATDAVQLYWSPNSAWVAVRGDYYVDNQNELIVTRVTGTGPFPPMPVHSPLTVNQDVSGGTGAFFFRRDSLGVFFEGDIAVNNDTEMWMSELSRGVPVGPTRLHPTIVSGGDGAFFDVQR